MQDTEGWREGNPFRESERVRKRAKNMEPKLEEMERVLKRVSKDPFPVPSDKIKLKLVRSEFRTTTTIRE